MKEGQKLWTEEELLLAINLYVKIPFGKMHHANPDVKELAILLDRTPGSIARRLGNFASMDPVLRERGIKGLSNAGKHAEKIWDRFYENFDGEFEKSELLLAKLKNSNVEKLYEPEIEKIELGLDKERSVKTRLNQYRFRQLVLSNFNSTCCITGIRQPELLIASHITPWSLDLLNRLNPANGLCLNALHDRAFDSGLLTVNAADYRIKISPHIHKLKDTSTQKYLLDYEGAEIILPKKFLPHPQFLKTHNLFFEGKITQ